MIYFRQSKKGGPIKIGSTTNLKRRLKQHSREDSEDDMEVLGVIDGGPAEERELHARFAPLKVDDTPICERFSPNNRLLAFIREHARPWQESDDQPSTATANALVIRGSAEWRDWLRSVADHDRTSVAEVIDRAVVDYARKIGVRKAAPKR